MFEVIKNKNFCVLFLDFYFSTLSVKRLRLLTKSRHYGRVAQLEERRKIIDSCKNS